MPTITLAQAKKLCTAEEYALVESSHSAAAPLPVLRERLARARRLRDKYRRLAAGQRREQRGKAAGPAESNDNTVRKARLFAETIERYSERIERRRAPVAAAEPE